MRMRESAVDLDALSDEIEQLARDEVKGPEAYAQPGRRALAVVEQPPLPPAAPAARQPLSEAAAKLMAEVDIKRVEALRDQQNQMCDAAVAQAITEQARWRAWGDELVEQTRIGIEQRARVHAGQQAFFEGSQALADQHGLPLPVLAGRYDPTS
jgi:hypothetical protein